MRVSLNWLKEYVDIPVGVDELADTLTMLGLEIEAIERPGHDITQVYVGQIQSIEPHPDADKLVVCHTDIGREEPLQIVCGAKNMKEGDKVPTAIVGATLAGSFEIGRRKMRGVESEGMMCSACELGLGDDHTGLMILDPELEVGTDCIPLFGFNDVVFELEVTPNRGDWACMIGVARELAAVFGTQVRIPEIAIEETQPKASDLSSVTIENADLCPRYIGRVLNDVKIGPSPLWLCKCLIAAGQRPINNVVDITNYVLMETGHPLHAFDYDRLKENRIVVRNPKAGEKIATIDGEEHVLDPEMCIIADAESPVAVAGVMGGGQSEVGDSTARVFLESAYFKPTSIRRTARTLGMQTEASTRFQRGADPEMAVYALNRAAMLMQQLAGATVAEGMLDEYPAPLPQNEVTLRYSRCDQLLGTIVSPETQRNILLGLGFKEIESTTEQCTVRTPTWRHDVAREADLIEEVARLYGYDKINATLATVTPDETVFAPQEPVVRALRERLAGYGLTEFFNWTFSCPEDVKQCGLEEAYLNMVTLDNPLSEKQATMRSSLMPTLLANAARNIRHGATDVAAFEVGPVYVPVPDRDLPDEPLHVAIVLSGRASQKHWSRDEQALDFFDLKGYCETILVQFGVTGTFDEADFGTFQTGQSAIVRSKKRILGRLGAVKHAILSTYGVSQPVYMLELDLSTLLGRKPEPAQFQPIPPFPPSRRDMAVVVESSTKAGELRNAALNAGGKLLKSVEIFDIYSGKQVPDGMKSVALNLVFQSDERTLTDKDTQKSWDKVLKKLERGFGAELR
ncbi:MAG: phenylalanine--tRNA ligase subunit beta [Nitrospiraceae bacterium]|nr:phenylalanine--tRNA ligase subunit beta [Nitrospiraceae bacterium]